MRGRTCIVGRLSPRLEGKLKAIYPTGLCMYRRNYNRIAECLFVPLNLHSCLTLNNSVQCTDKQQLS